MPYQVLYADPPWDHNVHPSATPLERTPGWPTGRSTTLLGKAYSSLASNSKYNTMKLDEIKDLQPGKVCEDDCVLFLWVLNGYLQQGLDLIKAWGFKYKTVAFCWVKVTSRGNPFHIISPLTRPGMEMCLYASRGRSSKVLQPWSNERQVVEVPEETELETEAIHASSPKHSRKPIEIRHAIERMTPDTRRLEMFAREMHLGWDAFGNEVEGISLAGHDTPSV